MDRPKKEDFIRGVNQIEYSQAIADYTDALEKYCDFKDELEVRRDLSQLKEGRNYIPYQKCPKCDGQGIVSKPPHIAGDQMQWDSTSVSHQCNVCNGDKVIPMIESQLKEERDKVKKLEQLLASTENQNKHLSRKILSQNPK